MVNRVSKNKRRDREDDRRGSKRSGFVYRKRDPATVKKHADQKGGTFDSPFKNGFDTWRPKGGDNLIRILPPTWDDAEHYGYELYVHSYVGATESTYPCPQKMLNKPCPICAAAKEAKDAGEADEAKQLQAKKVYACWILDRDEKEPIPQIYMMGWMMDRDIASLCHNRRTGSVLMIDHPDDGYDLVIKRTGERLRTRYQQVIERDPCPIDDDQKIQDKILEYIAENPIPDTIFYRDTEYLEGVISGTVQEKDEDLDEDEDEKPKRGRRARDEDDDDSPPRKGKRRDDEEDEDDPPPRRGRAARDEEDADEEEDDPPPPRRGRARGEEDEDEDEDEDPPTRRGKTRRDEQDEEDEDDPPPRRGRAPGRDEDDEEEDTAEDEEEEDDDPPPRRGKKSTARRTTRR